MVVFTCNHCGESLHKPRVEKHYNSQCREPKSLTCVDCFKDFKNEEYVVHTKCITEEERYSAKGSTPGGIVKKGEAKQESWVEMIKSIVQNEKNLKPSLHQLLHSISNHSNIPRKKAKFINFLKSSAGGRVNLDDIEAAWGLIENYKNQQEKSSAIDTPTNGHNNGVESVEKPTKHKASDVEEVPAKKKRKMEAEQSEVEASSKFCFKSAILNILSSKGSISCKKLQKKVLNLYLKETGNTEYTEKIIKRYNRKLKKLENVQINDDVVCINDI